MKKYICVNFLQCDYADEKPPKEFELADVLNNVCPECGSANIREIVLPRSTVPVWAFIAASIVVIAGLLWYGLRSWSDDTIKPPVVEATGNRVETGKTTTPTHNTSNTGGPNNQTGGSNPLPRIPKPAPVTYTKVAGSEFCIGDCILGYSEIDNLGHTRERRIENYAPCCPAEN